MTDDGTDDVTDGTDGLDSDSDPAPEIEDRVVIVGAGISGLTVARALIEDGREVIVLEARDRIGGRMHTMDVGPARLDVGAAWMHGVWSNPVIELVDTLGLARIKVDPDDGHAVIADHTAGVFTDQKVNQAWTITDDFYAQRLDLVTSLGDDASLKEASDVMIADGGHTDEAARLRSLMLEQYLGELDYGGPSGLVSLKWMDEESWYGPRDEVVVGGYSTLIDAIGDGVPVELNTYVTNITVLDGGVAVSSADDTWTGTEVVVTVPLGVLKAGAITFEPALSVDRQAAIDRLEMGNLEKVLLVFDEAFWTPVGHNFTYIDTEHGRYPFCADLSAAGGAPTLGCFTGGAFSRGGRATDSDEEAIAGTIENLGHVLKLDIPTPVATHVTRWLDDPLSFGSYSFVPTGAALTDLDVLAQPHEDRVLFAGEHTMSKYYQTVHGALLSGVREAERLGVDTTQIVGLENAASNLE